MELHLLEKDIKIIGVRASAFPEGILSAHQQLHQLVPFDTQRRYFALSRPENGQIVYWAGVAEQAANEALQFGLKEEKIIRAGNYKSILIKDYKKDIPAIAKAFEKLKQLPDIDPQGYCVEEIIDDIDLRCMVRMV